MQGIYQIKNINNNKVYVGSSKNILKRINNHIYNLEKQTHINYKLQNDYNKYGITAFSFSVLKIVKSCDELLDIEQKYIDNIDVKLNYNILDSTAPQNNTYSESIDTLDIMQFKSLKDKIVIFENYKMNFDDQEMNFLSRSWITNKNLKFIQNNLNNYYTNYSNGNIYWTSYDVCKNSLTFKGAKKRFINFESIPKEKKNNLAFLANIYTNPFLHKDDDSYALKLLLNWINNVSDIDKTIELYIPSKRMRNLLTDWL